MSTDLRDVEEKVRAAREREQRTRTEADVARREREQAEILIGPATRQAQATAADLKRDLESRLKDLQVQLERAAAMKDFSRPDPALRLRARIFLVGGGEAQTSDDPRNPASTLLGITTIDAAAAAWLGCSQTGGKLMQFVFENGGDEEMAGRADELECRAWSGLMKRIRALAGEQ